MRLEEAGKYSASLELHREILLRLANGHFRNASDIRATSQLRFDCLSGKTTESEILIREFSRSLFQPENLGGMLAGAWATKALRTILWLCIPAGLFALPILLVVPRHSGFVSGAGCLDRSARQHGVKYTDLHLECARAGCELAADLAETDDQQALARKLPCPEAVASSPAPLASATPRLRST